MRLDRGGAVLIAAGLLVVGCGSDDTSSSSDTTDAPTSVTPESTTTTVPAVTVDYKFTGEATPDQADQAAEVMAKRLEAYGYAGSTAEVTDDGTGLSITVLGVASADEANALVEPLTASGALYFRPVLAGPLAPAAGETASPDTQAVLDQLAPGTVPVGSDLPTTPPEADDPAGQAVLVQPDIDGYVLARWEVGPSQVDATAISDVEMTTYEGSQAMRVTMKEGSPGIDQFNALAEQCFNKAPECPSGADAVVFNSMVITASTIRPGESTFTPFAADDVIIWSPDWSEDQVKLYTAIMTVGELPVGLAPA